MKTEDFQQVSSKRSYLVFLLILALCLFLAFSVELPGSLPSVEQRVEVPQIEPAPDFASITDIDERKERFFDFLQPHIDYLNLNIMATRAELETLQDKVEDGIPLTREERNFITETSREYEVQPQRQYSENHLRTLLRRVDIIPSSLVLAQAANESAWGTSRFAVDGNNYFGQWCYSEGCGLVPSRRGENANHEVKRFASAAESVKAYFMNLNTFASYQELRQIRQQMRRNNEPINGIELAEGLQSYSERGEAYIEELQSMIQYNNLQSRDSV